VSDAEPEHSDLTRHPLRIAMVATPWYEIPPNGYGGLELICAALVDALVARGHDVTLFGAGRRSGTKATFVSTSEELQYPRLGEEMPGLLHAARVNNMLATQDFDVIHDHSMAGPLTAPQRSAPTVLTVHGPPDGELGDYYELLGDTVQLVAISESQRQSRSSLPWAATVHNSIRLSEFTVRAANDGPVLWLARFCPDKGPDLAIQACREAGLPLVLVGKCNEAAEKRYLDEKIRPLLGDDVELVLNADRATTKGLLSAARCLIMPIRWQEPFGMVMIEAMASGTPVVALRRGSVPELVRDGITGFICDEPDELPGALLAVKTLDPMDCVAHVRGSFSAELMAERYEQVYRTAMRNSMTSRRGPATRTPAPTPIGTRALSLSTMVNDRNVALRPTSSQRPARPTRPRISGSTN
jgi:glycosyltransferase involved in cell wall biosynthesis